MESIWILKHIYLNESFYFFLLIIILTGKFNYFIIYFILLLIHELGHAITGIILGYKLERIEFYPMGGVTILDFPINISLRKELLILVMGPIMQIVGYMFLKRNFPYINTYHYTLLFFNLLPLYPLDGGRIVNILLNYKMNYLKSLQVIYYISIITIITLVIYNIFYFNLNLILMAFFMLYKLVKLHRNRYYYYQKLLLERYLHNYHFHKIKNIENINSLYRDCYHYINFIKEDDYLKNYFKNK